MGYEQNNINHGLMVFTKDQCGKEFEYTFCLCSHVFQILKKLKGKKNYFI